MDSKHASSHRFPIVDAFTRILSAKKTPKRCPDVTQRSFGVRNGSHVAWGPTLGILTWCQSLVSFHAGQHIAHVQSPSFGSAVGGARRTLFFWTQPNGPKFFSRNGMTMDIMHANSHRFPTLDAFTRILPAKRTRNAART